MYLLFLHPKGYDFVPKSQISRKADLLRVYLSGNPPVLGKLSPLAGLVAAGEAPRGASPAAAAKYPSTNSI